VWEEILEKYKRNALKQFYKGIRKIRRGFQPRTTMCRNKQGVIARGEKDVLERGTTYFKELLNPQVNIRAPQETTYFGPACNIADPTLQETLEIIRNAEQQSTW
jgi:hypothetical protein